MTSTIELTDEWKGLVFRSKEATKYELDNVVDESIIHMDEHMQSLILKNKILAKTLREIQDMCVGEIAMGYSLDANAIGEHIYNSTGIKAT